MLHAACAAAGITAQVTVEPGRAIAAAAGLTLYRVGTIKDIPGVRTYVSVDGGHERQPPARPLRQRLRGVPAPGDRWPSGPARSPSWASTASRATSSCATPTCPPTSPSATSSCTPVTGAYGHSMASNYNKVPRPPVVFVAGGEARVVVRRETFDDLLRLDT